MQGCLYSVTQIKTNTEILNIPVITSMTGFVLLHKMQFKYQKLFNEIYIEKLLVSEAGFH